MPDYPPPPYGYSPPPAPPPPPEGEWPEPAKAAVGCGSLCGIAVLMEAAMIWAGLRLTFGPHGLPAPGGYARPLESPAVVGKPFPAELILRNSGVSTLHIVTVKVPIGEKDAMVLSDPNPVPKQLTRAKGEETWRYDHSLAPRQELRIRFRATPIKQGPVKAMLTVHSETPKSFFLEVKANPKAKLR